MQCQSFEEGNARRHRAHHRRNPRVQALELSRFAEEFTPSVVECVFPLPPTLSPFGIQLRKWMTDVKKKDFAEVAEEVISQLKLQDLEFRVYSQQRGNSSQCELSQVVPERISVLGASSELNLKVVHVFFHTKQHFTNLKAANPGSIPTGALNADAAGLLEGTIQILPASSPPAVFSIVDYGAYPSGLSSGTFENLRTVLSRDRFLARVCNLFNIYDKNIPVGNCCAVTTVLVGLLDHPQIGMTENQLFKLLTLPAASSK